MQDDKTFAVYALSLIGGVALLLTTLVLVQVTTLPSLGVFVEHASLGLLFRASYKSLDGTNPLVDVLRVWGMIGSDESSPLLGDVVAAPA